MRPSLPLVLLAVPALMAGCSNGEAAERIAQEQEAREALEARVDELESQLDDALDEDDEELASARALSSVEDDVASAAERLDTVQERLDEADQDRAALREDYEGATGDLRSTLADAQERLDALEGEASQLRTLYETLRDRLDEQQRG